MRALLLAGVVACGSMGTARAAYILTVTEQGGSVVESGSGQIDLSGLRKYASNQFSNYLDFNSSRAIIGGGAVPQIIDIYEPLSSYLAPANFGIGGEFTSTNGSGDTAYVANANGFAIFVPAGYVSNTRLTSSAVFADQTFSSLGVNTGTYVFSFGTYADTFTVNIGTPAAAAVPEPTSLALLSMSVVGVGVAGAWRRRTA